MKERKTTNCCSVYSPRSKRRIVCSQTKRRKSSIVHFLDVLNTNYNKRTGHQNKRIKSKKEHGSFAAAGPFALHKYVPTFGFSAKEEKYP